MFDYSFETYFKKITDNLIEILYQIAGESVYNMGIMSSCEAKSPHSGAFKFQLMYTLSGAFNPYLFTNLTTLAQHNHFSQVPKMVIGQTWTKSGLYKKTKPPLGGSRTVSLSSALVVWAGNWNGHEWNSLSEYVEAERLHSWVHFAFVVPVGVGTIYTILVNTTVKATPHIKDEKRLHIHFRRCVGDDTNVAPPLERADTRRAVPRVSVL